MKSKSIYIGMTLALGLSQMAFANYHDDLSLSSEERKEREKEISDEDEWNQRTYNELQERESAPQEQEFMDASPAYESMEMEEYED